jgi:ATP-dependent Lhr-like helicase
MNNRPYDILVHQALSITKENSGLQLSNLTNQLKKNFAFKQIEISEIELILNHLIEIDLLEKLQGEVIIGIEGEYIVNSRGFYSVFKTEENFKVINSGNTIGQIPFSPQIIEDENILLSAKIWKIKFIDHNAKKIEVIPAKDGKKPMFFGGGADINQRIREKMLEVLYSKENYGFLDQPSFEEINLLRNSFSVFSLTELKTERPLLLAEKHLQLFSFSGSRINRTIQLLLKIAGIKSNLDDSNSSFDIEITKKELLSKWDNIVNPLSDIDSYLLTLMQDNPTLLDFSKWGTLLPDRFKVKLLKHKLNDIERTEQLLTSIKLIENV